MKSNFVMITILCLCFINSNVFAEHNHNGDAEVAVGYDNNKLTVVELPDVIQLVIDPLNSNYYTCSEICWISTEPLTASPDSSNPGWIIQLQKLTASQGLLALNEENLIFDGTDIFTIGTPAYDSEEGWHFHNHLSFAISADSVAPGEILTATFLLNDTGTTGFESSDSFTLSFCVVPEPASMAILACGSLFLLRRKRNA